MHFSLYGTMFLVYNKINYDQKEADAVGCMKCGKNLGESQVFCDECLEKMAKVPVDPNIAVNLPHRPTAPVAKKKLIPHRYFWNIEGENDVLRTKIRWLRFALTVAIIGFLLSVALILLMLYRQGELGFIAKYLSF